MAEGAALLRLLAWLSPAFPTGGFAWSHGIEWAVEAGDLRDAASLRDWAEDLLREGAGRTDAILLRHAHAAHADPAALAGVAAFGRAAQPARERLAETVQQGEAFCRAACAWGMTPHPGMPYPVAVGVLAGEHAIDVEATCAGYLQALAATLISAAVRLIPLGQSAGLAVLAGLEPVLLEVAATSRGAALEEIASTAFRADLAAMRHETQYTRLFRS